MKKKSLKNLELKKNVISSITPTEASASVGGGSGLQMCTSNMVSQCLDCPWSQYPEDTYLCGPGTM